MIRYLLKPQFIIFSAIFVFYYWLGTDGREAFNQACSDGWYNLLVDGLLKGQVNFPVEVNPNLLTLSDPYDPAQNGPYRLHDMAYYKGKFYLYYGVSPALILFLPFRILFGAPLPENTAIMIFLFGGLIFSYLTISSVSKKYFNIPNWMLYFSIPVMALASVAPFMLKRTMMYEVSSSGGYFFILGAVYFLIQAIQNSKNCNKLCFLGSLFLGLAVGSRPHFIFSSVILAFVWLKLNKKNFKTLFLPFLAYIGILLIYNYLRFESPLEFGWKLILAGHYVQNYKFLNLENAIPGIYLYLFKDLYINETLPFFHLTGDIPLNIKTPLNYFHIGMTGLLRGVPFVLIMLVFPIIDKLFDKNNADLKIKFPINEFLISIIPATLTLTFLILGPQVEFRYLGDFTHLFLICSFFVWYYFQTIASDKNVKLVYKSISVILGTVSILVGLAFSTEPYIEKLRQNDFNKYQKIESSLKPFVSPFIMK